jgi:hypothetical protein
MSAAGEAMTSTIIVNGTRIEQLDRGHGQPILFLHLVSVSMRRRRCSQCWPKVDG